MRIVLLAGLIAAFAQPVTAQQAQDWDVVRDPAKQTTLVYTAFDVGLSIAVRCMGQSYQALIAGLPPVDTAQRVLGVAFGDEEIHDQRWNATGDANIAVSSLPARFARELREGGTLKLRVPGGAEDGRNLVYVLDLPASSTAIDDSLTACGRPLVDARDAEIAEIGEGSLPNGFEWTRMPAPEYPMNNYLSGFAVLTCLSNPNGALRDCVVETEYPQNGGFGTAALRSIRPARVRAIDFPEDQTPTRFIEFRLNFAMEDEVQVRSRFPRDRVSSD